MATPPEKALQEVFKQANMLGNIHAKLQQLNQLNELWQHAVPALLAQNSCVANWREGCLVIELKSAAWATRLQYLIPELIERLQQHAELKNLTAIDWYIQPSTNLPAATPPTLTLSAQQAQLLQDTAEHIDNEMLKAALQKLAINRKP